MLLCLVVLYMFVLCFQMLNLSVFSSICHAGQVVCIRASSLKTAAAAGNWVDKNRFRAGKTCNRKLLQLLLTANVFTISVVFATYSASLSWPKNKKKRIELNWRIVTLFCTVFVVLCTFRKTHKSHNLSYIKWLKDGHLFFIGLSLNFFWHLTKWH